MNYLAANSGRAVVLFFLGAFAGMVSVFLPRLMLSISVDTQPAGGSYISLYSTDFLIIGLVFSAFLGVLLAIFESGEKPRPAKDAFLAALGIPALLSGVLNTASATNKLEKVEQAKTLEVKRLGDELGISQVPATSSSLEVIGLVPFDAGKPKPSSSSSLSLFPLAMADNSMQQVAELPKPFDPGIALKRSAYVVVLQSASNEAEAMQKLATVRKVVPAAQAVKAGDAYYIVDSASLRTQTDALISAKRLKDREKSLSPSLLQVSQ